MDNQNNYSSGWPDTTKYVFLILCVSKLPNPDMFSNCARAEESWGIVTPDVVHLLLDVFLEAVGKDWVLNDWGWLGLEFHGHLIYFP